MPGYSFDQLRDEGPQFAMAMLLRCLDAGEPFVTYGDIGDELEHQLRIGSINNRHIGVVAGALMDKILTVDRNAPLINTLITQPSGLPGDGAGGYFERRYKRPRYNNWKELPTNVRRTLVDKERAKVFQYRRWAEINEELFGPKALSKLRDQQGSEADGRSSNGRNHGGVAESQEHIRLKNWVAENPHQIGIRKAFGKGTTKARLLSGDSVDVLFSDGNDFITVEVKSCRSNDVDFQRGIYQCVKYRKVKEAEQAPNNVNVQTLLVTERELSSHLRDRARLLNVKFKCVSVNT